MSWNIDTSHSEIQFVVRHMMLSKVRGQFEKFTGTVNLDEHNPVNTTVDIQIETNSVNTRDAKRDGHLRSPDFFNSDTYPFMTFKSRKVEQLDASHARLLGDLTIRGETRPVALDVEHLGMVKNPWGMTSAGFAASTKINRKDWGLTWNMALEAGGVLVGDEIEINIELELVKQPEAQPVAA
jgi:polyisoprenoid-binding protein YceI